MMTRHQKKHWSEAAADLIVLAILATGILATFALPVWFALVAF